MEFVEAGMTLLCREPLCAIVKALHNVENDLMLACGALFLVYICLLWVDSRRRQVHSTAIMLTHRLTYLEYIRQMAIGSIVGRIPFVYCFTLRKPCKKVTKRYRFDVTVKLPI